MSLRLWNKSLVLPLTSYHSTEASLVKIPQIVSSPPPPSPSPYMVPWHSMYSLPDNKTCSKVINKQFLRGLHLYTSLRMLEKGYVCFLMHNLLDYKIVLWMTWWW